MINEDEITPIEWQRADAFIEAYEGAGGTFLYYPKCDTIWLGAPMEALARTNEIQCPGDVQLVVVCRLKQQFQSGERS